MTLNCATPHILLGLFCIYRTFPTSWHCLVGENLGNILYFIWIIPSIRLALHHHHRCLWSSSPCTYSDYAEAYSNIPQDDSYKVGLSNGDRRSKPPSLTSPLWSRFGENLPFVENIVSIGASWSVHSELILSLRPRFDLSKPRRAKWDLLATLRFIKSFMRHYQL